MTREDKERQPGEPRICWRRRLDVGFARLSARLLVDRERSVPRDAPMIGTGLLYITGMAGLLPVLRPMLGGLSIGNAAKFLCMKLQNLCR